MAFKINYDLTNWTMAERLWLWRRVEGLTQTEAARKLRLSRSQLQLCENGTRANTYIAVEKRRVKPSFLLVLARRRWGRGLHATAQAAGVTHVTLLDREKGCDPRLVQFWQKRGFKL